ncbi:PAN-4 domain containing protein [Pyrenophora tritici-repentis]|nr:PAN-4 domain containing protein [Pyrenophora tritici-repentis]
MTSQPTGPITCPAYNGTTYTAGSKVFLVLCDADINGDTFPGPISPTYPGSYEKCLLDCQSTPGCVAVSYVKGGPCYLKGSAAGSNPNANIIGGKLIHGSPAASTPASGFSTVTVTSCATTGSSASGSSATGSSTTSSATPTTTSRTCPEGDGAIYTTECGAEYALECGVDRFGNDLKNGLVFADTWERCVQACDMTSGCVSVSWVSERHGACYMKSSVGKVHNNSNIEGGRKISDCNRLKLHGKRVVHEKRALALTTPGRFFNPDYTFIRETLTFTTYTTLLPVFTTTPLAQPATITKFVVASTVITITTSVPSQVFSGVTHITKCPLSTSTV